MQVLNIYMIHICQKLIRNDYFILKIFKKSPVDYFEPKIINDYLACFLFTEYFLCVLIK